MTLQEAQARRQQRARERQRRARRRSVALLSVAIAIAIAVALVATGGKGGSGVEGKSGSSVRTARFNHRPGRPLAASHGPGGSRASIVNDRGSPGVGSVPILMYHVINPPPPGAPFPGLYVPAAQFAAQMDALKAAGWHAVTLDQLEANWTRGQPLGPGKPVVLTFDNGYASQYTNALPVLKRLGWVGVENIQLSGLPPSQGGLTTEQVHGLLTAGWELDTQGISHADLIKLDSGELHYQIATARQILRTRYGVPVNWFCYPSGHYDATVIDEVRAAGFIGSTTVIPGWASRRDDPYRLPRLRVLGGTSPAALLSQVASAQADPPAPAAYGGAGTA